MIPLITFTVLYLSLSQTSRQYIQLINIPDVNELSKCHPNVLVSFSCSYLIIYNFFFVVPYLYLGPSQTEYATTTYTKVNTIAPDALVPCIARGSVSLVLTTSTKELNFIWGN